MLKIILTLSLIAAVVTSHPVDDSGVDKGLSINSLFAQINDLLKREITKDLGNETEIEVGDKFKNDKGQVEITVQTFSFGTDNFPVTFNQTDGEGIAEDKEIIAITGDFDEETAIYKIENEDSDEDSGEVTAKVDEVTKAATTVDSKKKLSPSEATTQATKEQKILKEVAQQPILTGV